MFATQYTIKGVSKSEIRILTDAKVYKDHAWNAVKIGNKWFLLDSTWAAAYYQLTALKKDINIKDFYYKTPAS